jgi:hypothetical protein
MPAFSQARWSQFVGLCGLVLLAEGLSRGVNGLLRIVRNEAYLRGSDAVILLDKKVWADITGHGVPAAAGMAQAIIPRGTATTRRRGHGGRRLSRTRTTPWTAPHRTRRMHLGTPPGSTGARGRLGRQRLRSSRGGRL